MRYTITNAHSGAVQGTFDADSPTAALDAWARDAGYGDYATLDREVPSSPDEIRVEPAGRAEVRALVADWEGEETIEEAIARLRNVPDDSVSIDQDGDVHAGGHWLNEETMDTLVQQLRGIGYRV